MKLVLENGQVIDFNHIQISEVTPNHRILISIQEECCSNDDMFEAYEHLAKFFQPAKVMILNGNIKFDGMEMIEAVH